MVIAEIKVVPMGTPGTSLSCYVAACVNVAQRAKGVTCQVTAMGTIMQGSLDEILKIMQKMHEVPFTMGATRVSTTLSIDDRRDKPATIESKVNSVMDKL